MDDTARRARRTWVSGHPSLKGRLLALTRRAIRSATDYADLIIGRITFNEDGLATVHSADFLADPRFVRAYELGKATGSWRESDIRWRCYVCCWAASHASHLEGDFVECGVYRGGYSRALIDYVDLPSLGKTMYLLDTFEGLVDEHIGEADRAAGRQVGGYEDSYDDVVRTFAGLPVKIIKGAVPDTLPLLDCEKISYLSLDMNCTPPERAAIEFLWPRLVPGAVIVNDDYGHVGHDPQRQAFDEFAATQGLEVLVLPTGQGLLFKPAR